MNTISALEQALSNLADARFVGDTVKRLRHHHGEHYDKFAEHHLQLLLNYLGKDTDRFASACDSFIDMTLETLRLQNEYYRTGRFSAIDELGCELHHNESLMVGKYLTGLYLAQVLWENHFEKIKFFQRHFLPRLKGKERVLDVGSGPGTYSLLTMASGVSMVTANDISIHSRTMIEGLVNKNCIKTAGFKFIEGDFTAHFSHQTSTYDAVIFCEVIEHLKNPEAGMQVLIDILRPGGIVFFSTATNAAFYDHTIVFKEVGEILDLLARFGLSVIEESRFIALKGPKGRDLIDYNAVLTVGE